MAEVHRVLASILALPSQQRDRSMTFDRRVILDSYHVPSDVLHRTGGARVKAVAVRGADPSRSNAYAVPFSPAGAAK